MLIKNADNIFDTLNEIFNQHIMYAVLHGLKFNNPRVI